MVAVCEDGGHAGIIKLNVLVVDFDKADSRVLGDEWDKGRLNGSRDRALTKEVSFRVAMKNNQKHQRHTSWS